MYWPSDNCSSSFSTTTVMHDVDFNKPKMVISLLLVWKRTRPFSLLFSPLLTCCAKSCSLNQTFMTACAQSWHPVKLGHMSFHIKILSSARQGETGVPLQYRRSAQGARNSCDITHGYKRFDFRVACPLHTLLSKNLLMLQIFPFAQLKFYNFIQLLLFISLFLICTQSAAFPF